MWPSPVRDQDFEVARAGLGIMDSCALWQLAPGGAARRTGLNHELLTTRALRWRYPQHRLGDSDGVLFDPEAESSIEVPVLALF